MHTTVLLLGGNLGPVATHFKQAERRLAPYLTIEARSSIHRTAPWQMDEGTPDFLNQAWLCHTRLAPNVLLQALQAVEQEMGRHPQMGPGYQSRPLDLDIIFYDDWVLDEPALKIPHPEMAHRPFVLAPLAEIVPEYRHPVLRKTVRTLLTELQ